MAFTEQQVALQTVRTIWGKSGFTEDCLNYKRVGCRRYWAIGNTWEEAIDNLKLKVMP